MCSIDLQTRPIIPFGGPGAVVNCDESKFNHKAKVSAMQKEISASFNLHHYITSGTGCWKGEKRYPLHKSLVRELEFLEFE